jgi:hypothetical protein
LDSLTLSQLKGLLESHYFVKLSDEYLFRESTSIEKLADIVQLGYAPDDSGNGLNEGIIGSGAAAASSDIGKSKGIAGALGCPPGVICAIL